ncbi:DUF456 domain-containing protein [Capnocytophaga sp.]|uniref:DUF456 domain-containing protein n=1 Tax=Capnocytophaga sp. TaxID=44737 RepID=UPI0026DD0FB4|nr:DUF456 domain-containing protein [Capnocytophaga sp.]MDO5106433.1 DUF456 domain-containing protein [Capnocytophaga sp.]
MIKLIFSIALILIWIPLSLFWFGVKRTILLNQYVLIGLCISLIIIVLLSMFLPRPERYDIPPFALWGVLLGSIAGFFICFQIGLLLHQHLNNQTVEKSSGYFLILTFIIVLASVFIVSKDYSLNKKSENQLNTQNSESTPKLKKRYFLGNSDLHKQKSNRPTYLYDEISENEAISQEKDRAYYVGYFQGDTLIRYEKHYRGEMLFEKQINDLSLNK